jgi:3-phosphoshikimate 1-carboxyvinyltransferase
MLQQIALPGSKSLSNRVLLLAALSDGTTLVENLLDSADIRYMVDALKQLKVQNSARLAPSTNVCAHTQVAVDVDFDLKRATVQGHAGPFECMEETLFLGNAGTAMRPLTAAVCAGTGRYVLDGVPRMRERPIKDLVDGLQQVCGARHRLWCLNSAVGSLGPTYRAATPDARRWL